MFKNGFWLIITFAIAITSLVIGLLAFSKTEQKTVVPPTKILYVSPVVSRAVELTATPSALPLKATLPVKTVVPTK